MKTYILSGGNSSRMGEDKGLKPVAGKPAVCYLLETLRSIALPPVIIAHQEQYAQLGVPVIGDVIRGMGPMGGIYTALLDAGEEVLILAADAPFITTSVIRELLEKREEGKISVIRYNGRLQPLCGVYPLSCLAAVETRIRESRLKMMRLLEEYPVHIIDLAGVDHIFHNMNTPADFLAAESYLQAMNMKCFGKLTDIITEAPAPGFPVSVRDLKAFLLNKYPELASVEYKVAVNQRIIADQEWMLQASDEIALLPAFSGG